MAPAISGSSAAKPEWPSVRQSPPPYRSRGGSCRYAPRLAHLTRVRRREGPLPAGLAIMASSLGEGRAIEADTARLGGVRGTLWNECLAMQSRAQSPLSTFRSEPRCNIVVHPIELSVLEAGSAIAASNHSPVVLNCMIASQV
jgi:hypothetical protein